MPAPRGRKNGGSATRSDGAMETMQVSQPPSDDSSLGKSARPARRSLLRTLPADKGKTLLGVKDQWGGNQGPLDKREKNLFQSSDRPPLSTRETRRFRSRQGIEKGAPTTIRIGNAELGGPQKDALGQKKSMCQTGTMLRP